MDNQFFEKYSPSELYAYVGCGAEYVFYEDEHVTHLDIPYLFPSETVFRLRAFIDICRSQHATDEGHPSNYEEVWVNGSLKARGGFSFGRPFGCWRFFHDNGQCSEVVNLKADGNIYGEHALFDVKGSKLFSFCYQGPGFTGTLKEWYLNGQIKTELMASNGNRDGACRRWYENGRIANDTEFAAGELVGGFKQWNAEGVLVFERVPVENTRFYHEKQYNDQGQIMRMRSYLDHKLHGEEIVYFDYELKVMFDKPQGAYYVLGNKVTQDDFFGWKGEGV